MRSKMFNYIKSKILTVDEGFEKLEKSYDLIEKDHEFREQQIDAALYYLSKKGESVVLDIKSANFWNRFINLPK